MGKSPYVNFKFAVEGLPDDLFEVLEFKVNEELGKPFSAKIAVLSTQAELDPEKVLMHSAKLSVASQVQQIAFSGHVVSYRQGFNYHNKTLYRMRLVPRFTALQRNHSCQIFQNQNLADIIRTVCKQCGVSNEILHLTYDYPTMDYVCQYGESHLDFISRWMELWGVYYFQDCSNPERMIITDAKIAHKRSTDENLTYSPLSGMAASRRLHSSVRSFFLERNTVQAKVKLRDYNYQESQIQLEAEEVVSPIGDGVHYEYGDMFQTEKEGRRLAQIRAEELAMRQELYHGESYAPWMRVGSLFGLSEHPNDKFNAEYLAVKMTHQGRSHRYLADGTQRDDNRSNSEPEYVCNFTAIPAGVQFRPERVTLKPRPAGFISAVIDAEGEGEQAYLDEQGRYKVRLPFNLATLPGGKASCWIRQMQPYGGNQTGMHFPLLKGAEVLLSFVDGDIDRPVIAGAVSNQQNRNLVNEKNKILNAIHTPGGSQIVIDDTKGETTMHFGGEGAIFSILHD
jgi:type VI secretion system secreted protein VgrG